MKAFRYVLLTIVALAPVIANGQTQPASTITEGDAEAREIHDWINRWTKAFSAKDTDRVMELYTDDVISYDLVPPLQYVEKPAYRADYQQFFSQYDSDLHVEIRDLHVGGEAVLEQVLGRLRQEFVASERAGLFDELKICLSAEDPHPSYREIGLRTGLKEATVKVAVHRLRRRYGELLRAQIAETLSDPWEVEDELRHLIAVLTR